MAAAVICDTSLHELGAGLIQRRHPHGGGEHLDEVLLPAQQHRILQPCNGGPNARVVGRGVPFECALFVLAEDLPWGRYDLAVQALLPIQVPERLKTLRKALDDYRARESAQAEKPVLGKHIVEWARRAGDRLDDLSDKGRREVLRLLLDGATIDRDNKVNLTLAIPIEDVVSIVGLEPSSPPT